MVQQARYFSKNPPKTHAIGILNKRSKGGHWNSFLHVGSPTSVSCLFIEPPPPPPPISNLTLNHSPGKLGSFRTQAFSADTLTVQYLVSVDGLVVNCP